ncbi:MAG: O-antigen ligase family protein [Anaerolineae bacterium]|nr:O-antigen ligase family protein [Anaerolineae bacterium]
MRTWAWCVWALAGIAYVAAPWPAAGIPLLICGWVVARRPGPGLALIAFTIPFYYTQKLWGTAWISHTDALIVVSLFWAVLYYRRSRGRLCGLDGAVAAFVLVGGLAAWVAPNWGDAWVALRQLILAPAGLYGLWRLLPIDRRGVRWATGGLIGGGMLMSAVGLAGYVDGQVVTAGAIPRLRSVYYSPNEAALFLVRVWPLAAALALEASGRLRWLLSAAAGLMLFALALTFSRGAWLLGVPVGVGVLWAARGCRRLWWWGVVGGIGAAFVVLARGGGLALRPEVWQAAWAMWRDHPWLGVGLDGFYQVYPRYMALDAWREPLLYHPHNAVLEIGTWMGILGLLALVAVGWSLLRLWSARDGCSPGVRVGLMAGWAAGLAHGMVDAFYVLPHLALWAMFALGIASFCAIDRELGCVRIVERAR